MINEFNEKCHPMVFSEESINTEELKGKCRAAILSLTRQHGLAERLSEACFMLALSELENAWKHRAEAAEARFAEVEEEFAFIMGQNDELASRLAEVESKPAGPAPDGWKLVPVEPTEEMLSGALKFPAQTRKQYAAMLAAAPKPSTD